MTENEKQIADSGGWRQFFCAAVCLTFAATLFAAEPDVPETWDTGTVEGWERKDPLNAITVPMDNPTDYLRVVFEEQSWAAPEVHVVRADVNASSGNFAGDYWITAITNVGFRLFCESNAPASLYLCFLSETSENWWYRPLNKPTTGEWAQYSVPLEYDDGWWLGSGGDSAMFKADRTNVTWVGIRIQRNNAINEQAYRIDDFVLYGASKLKDDDSDGATDWQEFIAGTDRGNPASIFEMRIGPTNAAQQVTGNIVRWTSAPDRIYTIKRTTSLLEGFVPIKAGILGDPPENEYEDTTATNEGAYFYKVLVE